MYNQFKNFLILKGLSNKSIEIYLGDFNRFHCLLEKVTSLLTPTQYDVNRTIQDFTLNFSQQKPSTRRRKICFLKHVVEFYNKEFNFNLSLINIKAPKTGYELPEIPSDDQIQKTLKKCELPNLVSVAIRILLDTGCRIGSLININIENIQDNQIILEQVKGGGSYKTLITNKTKDFLQTFIDGRKEGPLFLNKYKKRMSCEGIRWLMRNHLGSLYSHPHSYRHWIGTKLVEQNLSLFHIQKFMNHANIQSTQAYIHISQKSLNSEISKKHPMFVMSQ